MKNCKNPTSPVAEKFDAAVPRGSMLRLSEPRMWRMALRILNAIRRGEIRRDDLDRNFKRQFGDIQMNATLRMLRRRGLITGDGIGGYCVTVEGVGALALPRRRERRA